MSARFIYNSRDLAGSGFGLWASDGTAPGTGEIVPGAQGAGDLVPIHFTSFGSKALFAGGDSSGYSGLWITDGTTSGTMEILNGAQGSAGLSPHDLTKFNNEVVFSGGDAAGGVGLWITDGTAPGTRKIAAGLQGSSSLNPSGITVLGNLVLFLGADQSGQNGLWSTDGTTANTVELAASAQGSQVLKPSVSVVFGGLAAFGGTDSQGDYGLWVTDGTIPGTKEIRGTSVGATMLNPQNITGFGAKVVFSGNDINNTADQAVWISDGTAAGTKELLSGQQGAANLAPSGFTAFNSSILFSGVDASGARGLWITNGTSTTELVPGSQGSSAIGPNILNPGNFISFGGKEFFTGVDSTGYAGLWVTDGTAAGTIDIVTGAKGADGLFATNFTVAGNRLFFVGNDNSSHRDLWVSDGSVGGTTEIAPGQLDIEQQAPIASAYGNGVFFTAFDSANHNGLWFTDGTTGGTRELSTHGSSNAETLVLSQPSARQNDFNGDGFSDIALQNTDGSVAVWEMNGGASIYSNGAAVLANPGTSWKAIGGGYFFGDGMMDILLQQSSGDLAYWGVSRNGGPILDNSHTLALDLHPGAAWKAVATGEFNGDGMSDIVFQNIDGTVALWEMNGASLVTNGAAVLANPGTDWHVRGAGDFYDNGTSDILLQRDDGSLAIWGVMQGANGPTFNMSETVALAASLDPGPSWVVKGVGDFNGDGHADLIFQNAASGDVAVWLMNGASLLASGGIVSAGVVGSPGTSWQVTSIGDYNGDGISDVLLRNSQTGQLQMWSTNGSGLSVSHTTLAANPGTTWTPVG